MNFPQVIIPAAGEGTRIQDISFSRAKPLVPVCGKPVISWIFDSLMMQGFKKIKTVVPNKPTHDPTAIYLNDIYSGLLDLSYSVQKDQLGPLHAIHKALSAIKTKGVLIFLSDTICFENITENSFDESWIYLSRVFDYQPWCLAQLSNDYVKRLWDKPKSKVSSDLAIIGIYYFHDKEYLSDCTKEVITKRKKLNGEYQISSAIELYLKKYKVKGYITDNWYDCGSVENLRKTSDSLISKKTRAFNQLRLSTKTGILEKRSSGEFGSKTLIDELNFYESIPDDFKMYFPRIFDSDKKPESSKILFEYWPMNNLADTFLYFRYGHFLWNELVKNLVNIFEKFRTVPAYRELIVDTYNILWNKTIERIESLGEQNFSLIEKKIFIINNERYLGWPLLKDKIKKRSEEMSRKPIPAIIHGDMCFSNILSDISSGIIKLVDPRGRFGKTIGTLGDQRYDIAKLRQSYHGYYDFIVNNLYKIEEKKDDHYKLTLFNHFYHDEINKLFDLQLFRSSRINLSEIELIEGLLFISMCPLHYEDTNRQKAFWLRGIEILNHCLSGSYMEE